MMKLRHFKNRALLAIPCCLFAMTVEANDLSGVWATNVQQCDKIFVKKNGGVSFAKNSDVYGSGFIIEGDRIRAKTSTCSVKSRKEDGSVTHMVVACATEIMLLDTKFSMRLVDPATIERLYPGVPELNSRYERCEM